MNVYRIDRVRNHPSLSHADAVFPSVIALVTRLKDMRQFNLKLRRALELTEGMVVSLDDTMVVTCSINP